MLSLRHMRAGLARRFSTGPLYLPADHNQQQLAVCCSLLFSPSRMQALAVLLHRLTLQSSSISSSFPCKQHMAVPFAFMCKPLCLAERHLAIDDIEPWVTAGHRCKPSSLFGPFKQIKVEALNAFACQRVRIFRRPRVSLADSQEADAATPSFKSVLPGQTSVHSLTRLDFSRTWPATDSTSLAKLCVRHPALPRTTLDACAKLGAQAPPSLARRRLRQVHGRRAGVGRGADGDSRVRVVAPAAERRARSREG